MRCKCICHYKQPTNEGVHVHLSPVSSGSEENAKFFKLTPGGQISLYTVNARAADEIEVGKEYYLDFTPVEAKG